MSEGVRFTVSLTIAEGKLVDSDAVLTHLTGPVVQQWVPKLLGVSSLDSFEVYGDPGPKASAMLAGFGATVFSSVHALKA